VSEVEILADPEALAQRVAAWLVDLARAKEGTFAIALSGGKTPKRLYEVLATSPHLEAMPWGRIHWFWGDERFVPPEDPESNYGMVQDALLAHAPIPPANIHPIPTVDLSSAAAAGAYGDTLETFYGAAVFDPARPLFDVCLQGLGLDGHTASLFPKSSGLEEQRRWVLAVADPSGHPRITLTYPALECSRHVAFLVAGVEKQAILGRVLRGDATLPATRLARAANARIFADAAASGA
jgi:6-phosphogluconolactonase